MWLLLLPSVIYEVLFSFVVVAVAAAAAAAAAAVVVVINSKLTKHFVKFVSRVPYLRA